MAVPDSGVLSLLAIYNELAENNYSSGTSRTNVSLTNLSTGGNPPNEAINTVNAEGDRPDGGSNNHAMSEFYSYNHDAAGVGVPTSLSYTAASTTTTTFTFAEASSTTRVYVYLWDLNGDDENEGQPIFVDDPGDGSSTYITVDGSSTTSKTLGDGNDYYNDDSGDSPTTEALTLATNDYVDIKFRSWASSTYSSYTSALRCWTLPTAPGAPTLGSETINSIAVSWSTPTGGASSYILYMEAGDTTPDVSVSTPSATSLTISSLSSNTRYYARLKSVGGGGDNSDYGATSNTYTLPAKPDNLTSPSKTDTTVNLDWDAVSGTTQSYKVEYRPPLGTWTTFATGVTASEDQVTGLTASLTYGFRVSAANGAGVYGAVSNTLSVTTEAGKSDRRLKTNIERIGYSDMNIPIYLFNYKDDLNTTYQGVMAQDLLEMGLKDAVVMEDDGYYAVFYNKIDVNQIKVDN